MLILREINYNIPLSEEIVWDDGNIDRCAFPSAADLTLIPQKLDCLGSGNVRPSHNYFHLKSIFEDDLTGLKTK